MYRAHLDGLRAASALMVIYAHAWEHESKAASLGVRTFFVISGYLITNLLLSAREDAGHRGRALLSFVVRRGLRIWPAYYLLVAIYVVLDDYGEFRSALPYYASFTANLFMVFAKEWTPWNTCHLWSLSVEEQFYLVWPLFVLFSSRRVLAYVCVVATLIGMTHRVWSLELAGMMGDVLPFAAQDALCAGALIALYHRARGRFPAWLGALAVAGTLLILVPGAGPAYTVGSLVAIVAIVACAIDGFPGIMGRIFDNRQLRHVGRISYGIYLFHGLMIESLLWSAERAGLQLAPGPLLLVLTLPLVLMVASLSWHYFERPINELRHHFPYQKRASEPPHRAPVESLSV